MSTVYQRMSVVFSGSIGLLVYYLSQLAGDIVYLEDSEVTVLQVFNSIKVFSDLLVILVAQSRDWDLFGVNW